MAFNLETLAESIGIDVNDMLVEIERLNFKYNLGITSTELTRNQYDVIRSLHDPDYMVKVMLKTRGDRKYDYKSSPDYVHIREWMVGNNLNGFSTKDVKQMLPDHINSRGHQLIGCAMREGGYTSKVVILDNGKQGRRWYSDGLYADTPSFF